MKANLGPDAPKNHHGRCCCKLCDPGGARTVAYQERQRERAEAERKTRAALGNPPPASTRPRAAPRCETNIDRRFRQLLAAGTPAAEAIALIEAEERSRQP